MKQINKVLVATAIALWTAFFIEIWNITNYWIGVVLFLGLIALTGLTILTKPSAIKTMTEDEDEQTIEYMEEPDDWQECYRQAEEAELDRKVNEIVEELHRKRG